jgi:hypothetical protein
LPTTLLAITDNIANIAGLAVQITENEPVDDVGNIQDLPNSENSRIEVTARQRKEHTLFTLVWRWSVYNHDGKPVRNAHGTYLRGSRYGTSTTDGQAAERIKQALEIKAGVRKRTRGRPKLAGNTAGHGNVGIVA